MKNVNWSRAYLETLSSADLISLADEYGIDIPDDLNRQLIIGDLLEFAEEINDSLTKQESIQISDGTPETSCELPKSYNETRIDAIVRNPVSLFVWWDFNENELRSLHASKTSVRLCVCFFDSKDEEKPADSFDIQINLNDREQFVLNQNRKKFVRLDLIKEEPFSQGTIDEEANPSAGKNSVLCYSEMLEIPQGNNSLLSLRPGEKFRMSPAMKLSGTTELLKKHYNEHRQSFY